MRVRASYQRHHTRYGYSQACESFAFVGVGYRHDEASMQLLVPTVQPLTKSSQTRATSSCSAKTGSTASTGVSFTIVKKANADPGYGTELTQKYTLEEACLAAPFFLESFGGNPF